VRERSVRFNFRVEWNIILISVGEFNIYMICMRERNIIFTFMGGGGCNIILNCMGASNISSVVIRECPTVRSCTRTHHVFHPLIKTCHIILILGYVHLTCFSTRKVCSRVLPARPVVSQAEKHPQYIR